MSKQLLYYKKNLALIEEDPLLEPFQPEIRARLAYYQKTRDDIEAEFGDLTTFAAAYQYFGFHYDAKTKGWWYREWAPGAIGLSLVGDFNGWDPFETVLKRVGNGLWEIFMPDHQYGERLVHTSRIKVHVRTVGHAMDRIPAYIRRVMKDAVFQDFAGQMWKPKLPFVWQDKTFDLAKIGTPFIYECHAGMALEREEVGTWKMFVLKVLPRIKKQGYNVIQMMAVQEHPYYASFGYHVSNFFAPSSRFGTPEDLKYLVNEAHILGIAVIMDIVHSHSVKNTMEGLNEFDGTENQYFHAGARGEHPAWDSKCFDYGKKEVQMFLLSNLSYWLNEYHIDGFRFDGVTSMLYFHHGLGVGFDEYEKYFGADVDKDGMTYLRLANELVHQIKPHAITIAEDMSGIPGTCRSVEEGGLGFDYRLAMGIPDFWIKTIKHKADEDWSLQEIWNTLTNRRFKEANIAYTESHDQALVGDKTIAFWLMDKEMYSGMETKEQNLVIDRGMALHKIIRLLTISLGGDAYLNFMGNEFGHPEWIDFPREGNDWSHKYARRQWSLVDDAGLKYHFLNDFDKEMIRIMKENEVLTGGFAEQLWVDEENKVMVYERKNLIFIVNLHTFESLFSYRVPVHKAGTYTALLNTDAAAFGGFGRIEAETSYVSQPSRKMGNVLSVYIPSRTMLVLGK